MNPSSSSSRGYPPVSNYDEQPPAYSYNYGDTASFLSENESPTSASRLNGSTMRLLPTTSNVDIDDDLNSDLGTYSQHQYGHEYPESTLYVSSPATTTTTVPKNAPSSALRPHHAADSKASIPMKKSSLSLSNSTIPPKRSSCTTPLSIASSSSHPLPSRSVKSNKTGGSGVSDVSSKGARCCVNNNNNRKNPVDKRPFSTPQDEQVPRVAIPAPLFSPRKKPISAQGSPSNKSVLSGISLGPEIVPNDHASQEGKANANTMAWYGSTGYTRGYSDRYFQSHDQGSPSRVSSIFDNGPSIPPPTASVVDGPPYPSRPVSPARSWNSSGPPDWARPPRPPSVLTSNYEPADLNGSPRPGTPSSRYGGSPRRPLPPAPRFVVPGSTDMRINIDDPNDYGYDVFGGGGRTIEPHDARNSVRSFMSDSTIVTEARDQMAKVDLDDDDDDLTSMIENNQHYGPAPEKQSRRGVRQAQMSKKEVQLINGELILECKIPTILHSFLPRRDDREFTHMRYTAVTCDPDDFIHKGYKLRQQIGSTMRETELFICITMYNEDEINFTRTMHGVMRNISHLCSRSKSRTWGRDGWKKIVVCIIADGRKKVHPRTLNALAALGVYQEGIAKNVVNQKQVTAHVYEYTTQVSLDPDLKFKGAEKGIMPCQVIFCLKEHNKKKLNSHRWFFNAFGRALQPNICILLDVGTKPAPTALYHLWKAFDQDSNVAGAAGEIKAGKGKGMLGLLNPLVASQNFEYKMSNILDKPLESVFGYITVLPGALSAYRFYALLNDADGNGPLNQYFKGETLHGKNADVFTANMYLAEDRILCWELVAKKEERWVLRFVKNAVGETDVPGKLTV